MFVKGQSGNPAGRPRGARNKVLAALDAIGAEYAERVLRRVVLEAAQGDMRAAEVLLRRVWPERRGRPLEFALPPLGSVADLPGAVAAVAEAVATGQVTPEEGQAVAAVLEQYRRMVETVEIEARLAALEARDR
jgi:hypothetical protein